jgi:hypothetical protein
MSKWSVDLSVLAERASVKVDTKVRQFTVELFTLVVSASPVDTGRFRANWHVEFGSPIYSVTKMTGEAIARREVSKVSSYPTGSKVYLTNNLPYAGRLEHGWSAQAPTGMIRVSVAQILAKYRR